MNQSAFKIKVIGEMLGFSQENLVVETMGFFLCLCTTLVKCYKNDTVTKHHSDFER